MKHPKNFRVVNLLMLTVAGIVNAFGITIFLTPSNCMTAVFQEPPCCWNKLLHRICPCLFSFYY